MKNMIRILTTRLYLGCGVAEYYSQERKATGSETVLDFRRQLLHHIGD
jgi:hypothetical protein